MKKLTKEQIEAKLKELKGLSRDAKYKGSIGRHYAMCYATVRRNACYYWEVLPNRHTCAVCGKSFGGKEAQEREREAIFDPTEDNPPPPLSRYERLRIDKWEYDGIIAVHKNIVDMGYDAVLEIACGDCIVNKGAYPFTFKFRLHAGDEYTISYPDLYINLPGSHSSLKPQDEAKSFTQGKYAIAESFLKDVWNNASSDPITQTYRNWLDSYSGSFEYDGEDWAIIFGALRGILGLNVE